MIGISALLSPSFAVTAQSSVYQEVITSSVTGGQASESNVSNTGSSHIEVTNRTVIQGKQYEYYFSTTTPEAVEHQVVIHTGVPIFSNTETGTMSASSSDESPLSDQAYQAWVISMIKIIQTLQLYVAHSF